jgi:hypothetical protein
MKSPDICCGPALALIDFLAGDIDNHPLTQSARQKLLQLSE